KPVITNPDLTSPFERCAFRSILAKHANGRTIKNSLTIDSPVLSEQNPGRGPPRRRLQSASYHGDCGAERAPQDIRILPDREVPVRASPPLWPSPTLWAGRAVPPAVSRSPCR